jgi:hypothetical protein
MSKAHSAQGIAHGAKSIGDGAKRKAHGARPCPYLRDFLKLVILRLSLSKSSNSSLSISEVIRLLRLSSIIIFAFSTVERLATFKKLAKSFTESEPGPSVYPVK